MAKQYKKALYIFRRDIRIPDNTALLAASEKSDTVVPAFFLDPRQTKQNEYFSENAFLFLRQSLTEVDKQLRTKNSQLFIFKKNPETIVTQLVKKEGIDAIFVNRDYTPFARTRDEALMKLCKKQGIGFHMYADALLTEPEQVHKKDGQPYSVYTAFYNTAKTIAVRKPDAGRVSNFYTGRIAESISCAAMQKMFSYTNEHLAVTGGRKKGLQLMRSIAGLQHYTAVRDIPAKVGTSMLSAHHKFGTVSIRETYHTAVQKLGKQSQFIKELYWRDFFTHIAWHNPHVFGKAFYDKYNTLTWPQSKKNLLAWQKGKTGFPIVDAGIRQLITTGYMHNRVRMITASFLVKDLHIDWREGEKFFAQHLVDYDPAVNNGNWQWAASTGADSQPYFRIFNPWLQQKKYDPKAEYIKEWISELQDVEPNVIHNLYKKEHTIQGYPKPIIDHKKESFVAKQRYKSLN